ncbi:MAG TPA: hypothetical protein VEL76_01895 [Gemmataceae bacterium]|nr:hypothetical protein [Gemmataceae bacterium]
MSAKRIDVLTEDDCRLCFYTDDVEETWQYGEHSTLFLLRSGVWWLCLHPRRYDGERWLYLFDEDAADWFVVAGLPEPKRLRALFQARRGECLAPRAPVPAAAPSQTERGDPSPTEEDGDGAHEAAQQAEADTPITVEAKAEADTDESVPEQPCKGAAPSAHDGPPVVLDHNPILNEQGEQRWRALVLGKEKHLTQREFKVIEVLVKAWPKGVPGTVLDRESRVPDARKCLEELKTADGHWRQVIVFPGHKGQGGYKLRWPESPGSPGIPSNPQ